MNDFAELRTWATVRQLEYIEAIEKYGSCTKAAKALGVNKDSVAGSIRSLRAFAAKNAPKTPEPVSPIRKGIKILVLPDVQAKPGVNFDYLARIGQYAVDKRPDVIVCIGDFADMPSLSSYDKGKKSFEGRRFKLDIEAAKDAMCAFLTPMWNHNKAHPKDQFKPRMVMTLGNHEDRISRVVNEDPKLHGLISIEGSLEYHVDGWEVYDFLKVVEIEGIAFSHYFQTGVMGRPASSAQAQLNKKHQSCVAGHQQGLQMVCSNTASGSLIWSVIIGSCYEHEEQYMGPQGNAHWRGFLMMHDCRDGTYDPMPVSLNYVNQRYAHIRAE